MPCTQRGFLRPPLYELIHLLCFAQLHLLFFFLVVINLPPVEHKLNEEAHFALSEGFITASIREWTLQE